MALKVKALEEHSRPKDYEQIRVKEMGNIIELMYTERKNHEIFIKKITYIILFPQTPSTLLLP